MNRRRFFGALTVIAAAGGLCTISALTAKLAEPEYIPRMRETGQWSLGSYYIDEETGEEGIIPEAYNVRHDVAYRDQYGEESQMSVDCCYDHEPSEEELISAREMARAVIKRHMKYSKQMAVGPATRFRLELPRGLKLARYV
jgi:hypothetical protein